MNNRNIIYGTYINAWFSEHFLAYLLSGGKYSCTLFPSPQGHIVIQHSETGIFRHLAKIWTATFGTAESDQDWGEIVGTEARSRQALEISARKWLSGTYQQRMDEISRLLSMSFVYLSKSSPHRSLFVASPNRATSRPGHRVFASLLIAPEGLGNESHWKTSAFESGFFHENFRWLPFEHCSTKMGSLDIDPVYSTLCPSITSTRSTSKFHLNMFQHSVDDAVMPDAITYGQECLCTHTLFGLDSTRVHIVLQ